MMELSERIIKILERNEFNIGEITKQDEEFYLEYGQSTPEGEDWWETLWFDGTEEGFIKAFTARANSFDVEEEAEVWIERRGKNGVPNSIKDLLKDAEWKKKMLLKLANDLEALRMKKLKKQQKEELAKEFVKAIKEMASKPNNLENFEGYLSQRFDIWMKIFASTPERLTEELKSFAEMEI